MANVKISDLTAAAAALGTQEFEVNESLVSKKVTGAQIATYVRGEVTLGDLGVTATASELNILDGVTATTAELNYTDGVTSNIQTQLDGKAATTTQDQATWEAGTSTTETIVSPAKVKAAIDDLVPALFNASGSAPLYACRAWVNFNGTGTVAIRASGNVSSITDNGTGDYTVNFATAMPDANYASAAWSSGAALDDSATAKTTSALRFNVYSFASVKIDAVVVSVAIFR